MQRYKKSVDKSWKCTFFRPISTTYRHFLLMVEDFLLTKLQIGALLNMKNNLNNFYNL